MSLSNEKAFQMVNAVTEQKKGGRSAGKVARATQEPKSVSVCDGPR